MNARLKKNFSKAGLLLLLLVSAITFSAFRFSHVVNISRYELALVIEKILRQAMPDLSVTAVEFIDLNNDGQLAISAVTGFRIMSGFPNTEFRPDQSLRNHELLHYLYRTWQILRMNAPSAKMTRQMAKLVGMGRNRFYSNLGSSFSVFSEQARSYELADYKVLNRICQILELEEQAQDLRITIEDAGFHKPITEAYVAVNSNAFAVDANGEVLVSSIKDRYLEILASAPGYYPLLLKRDRMQKNHLRIRLRPIRSTVAIRAKKKSDGKKLEKFKVRLDNGSEYSTDSGEILLEKVLPGYYEIQISAEGHRKVIRNICANDESIELEALL